MRPALATTIVTLFERENLSLNDIAAQFEIEPVIVKGVLLQYSSKFKELERGLGENESEQLAHDAQREISKEEMGEFLGAYKEIARYGESEFIRERALRNLINYGKKVTDGLGENDPRKLLKEVASGGNILNLNMIIQNAKAAKDKVRAEMDNILELEPATKDEGN